MVSSVSFPGIGSGIDSARLADALYDQLTLPNKLRSNQVDQLESENSSLEELRSKLLSLADKLDALRTVNGGTPALTAQSSNNDVVTVAADSSAEFSNFKVDVESIANSASGSFNRDFSSRVDYLLQDSSQAGSVSFTVGTGDSAYSFDVIVGELTTAEGFVNQFNQNADGKASASLVNLGSSSEPSYRIVFNSADAGTEKGTIAVSASNDELLGSSVLNSVTLEQATDARFKVSGVSDTIVRDTNNISDVVAGVSFQLKTTGTADISVAHDSDAALRTLTDFVAAFNNVVEFVNKEDAITPTRVDGETVNVYGSLASTDVDDRVLDNLRQVVRGVSSDSVSLASLGVKTERDGTLSIDEDQFRRAFNDAPDAATSVLTSVADEIAGVGGVAYQFTGYQNQIDLAVEANEAEIANIAGTVEDVERMASSREGSLLKQFTSLESIIAKLNQDASVITSLLTF
jgi:flagellar hook-associated protein 2